MKRVSLPDYKLPYLYERAGTYQYRRAIPPKFHALANGQREFKQSLGTKDIKKAVVRYGFVHEDFEAKITQMIQGKPLTEHVTPPISDVRDIATNLGLSYLSAAELTEKNDPAEIWRRISKWEEAGKPDGPMFDAIFGEVANTVTMNDVLNFYEKHIEDRLIGLNKRETAKKIRPVRLAVGRFNKFAGEGKDFKAISRAIALNYRSHLVEQMKAGRMGANTVNKQLTHLRKIVNLYIDQNGLEIANPFSKVSVHEEQRSRKPYTVKFIKDRWLTGNPFIGLNDEAKSILFAMIDTGCGGKEISGIAPDEINLAHAIPHIVIQKNAYRSLKTGHRGRTIPLVGNALKAFKAHPEGFPRYRESPGADNFSNTVMSFLRENGLLETPEHTVYGLRHMFMDRMRIHAFPEELQNYLMGHKHPTMGARYGDGYKDLQTQLKYMKRLTKDWR